MRGFDSKSLALAAVSVMLLGAAPVAQQPGTTPTPRLNGHPNLNGVWYPYAGHLAPDSSKKGETLQDGSIIASYAYERRYNQQPAAQAPRPARALPPYKPELLAKVKDLSDRQTEADPYTYSCKPPGVPRIGPPHQIVHLNDRLAAVRFERTLQHHRCGRTFSCRFPQQHHEAIFKPRRNRCGIENRAAW